MKKVTIKIVGELGVFPECQESDCSLKRQCANHCTAGDFRSEDGWKPDLQKIDGEWFCNGAFVNDFGAVLIQKGIGWSRKSKE